MAHSERFMVPLYLTDTEKKKLDKYATSLNLSRQKVLEAIFVSGLSDLETIDLISSLTKKASLLDQLKTFKS